MKALDVFTPAAIAAYWTENQSNRIPYIGSGFFPSAQKRGLDLSWFRGSNGLAVSLMPSAFDAKATFRDRIGVAKIETEMPFFREGYKIKERDRQELLRVAEAGDPYAQEVIARVFDDTSDLIRAAAIVRERERMQLLFAVGGKVQIVFQENGVDYSYDYDANGAWATTNYYPKTGPALWSASATADPIADLIAVINDRRMENGSIGRYAIMNTVTFNAMVACTAVQNRLISISTGAVAYAVPAELRTAVEQATGLTILIDDDQFMPYQGGTAAKYVPDGYVAVVPEGPLGSTWMGTTPEEADLMGSGAAEVAIVDTGVAVTKETTVNPVNVNIFASEIVLPSYERMNEVSCLKVL